MPSVTTDFRITSLGDNPSPREIVGVEFELNLIAGGQADEGEPMIPRGPGNAAMAVSELDAIGALLKDFDHGSPCLKLIRVGHGPTLQLKGEKVKVENAVIHRTYLVPRAVKGPP